MSSVTSANIVLTGFMGTGKTTVGRLLAELLDYEFVDTDVLIEERHGAIADIFREHGEQRFRELEHELAVELAGGEGRVISTGGRFMLDPANAELLGARARVFCLTATADVIARRVLVDGAPVRPLLAGDDPVARIAELLDERSQGYSRFEQVDTDDRTPAEIAELLALRLRRWR